MSFILQDEHAAAAALNKGEIIFAAITDFNTITFYISPEDILSDLSKIRLTCGGERVEIDGISANADEKVSSAALTVIRPLDISKVYELEIKGYGRSVVVPTEVFDTDEFKKSYLYDGKDLGATYSDGVTAFKVWVPTASKVVLNLFDSGADGTAYKRAEMKKDDKGVWSHVERCGCGTYYTYTVTTAVGEQEAVDPYAKAVGVNGDRGMVVDLDQTDPYGWANERYVGGMKKYSDAVIWEAHVRDFSNKIDASKYKGKFLAFTETGLTNADGIPVGIDHLKSLGITHVHLNPVYDYATVDEKNPDGQYNWGYDPKNYNAPEGSYSTDPYNGAVRINEFKRMVQALHAAGIGVIMDVVYNHTYDNNSNFNKIVPYYYYRYTPTGEFTNGSGCGNETASERAMFRKFMLDSLYYWETEYMLDGFRFDLMGLHDLQTMQLIESAVHAVNPQAIIYGEGWTGGPSALNEQMRTTVNNADKIVPSDGAIGGIAVFNDVMRDSVKGSVFSVADRGYINGNTSADIAIKVTFGIKGGERTEGVGWSVTGGNVINYVACHDNYTFYDKLKLSCPYASDDDIFRMSKLAASILMISKGTPFMLAGEEILRTKKGDANSYKSSDDVNNIDWDAVTYGGNAQKLSEFYKKLIDLRKTYDFLRYAEVRCKVLSDCSIDVFYTVDGYEVGRAVINPFDEAKPFSPGNGYIVVFDGENEGWIDTEITSVPAKSVMVLKKK